MNMESFTVQALINTLVVLAVFILPFVVGVFVAKAIKMADYGWQIGLILASIAIGALITANGWNDIKLGVDLDGGVILIYEIDQEASSASQDEGGEVSPAVVAAALRPRLDPSGAGDIVIRPYGDHQIEIIIPNVQSEEVDNIKRLISTSGYLEFRILVNQNDPKHDNLVDLAEQQRTSPNVGTRQSRYLYLPGAQVGVDQPQAAWVKIGLTDEEDKSKQEYKVDPARSGAAVLVRDGDTGNWITFGPDDASTFDVDPEKLAAARAKIGEEGSRGSIVYIRDALGVENPEILVATNSVREVQGKHLAAARLDTDMQTGTPAVSFTMNAEGSQNMAILTSNNVVDSDIRSGLYRYLGIVLDGRLLSAPRLQSMIADRGQITGQFTREEVEFLVNILRAGRLPAVLNPNPTSENRIDPLLGQTTIEKGSFAIGISLVAVLIFMGIYYRFAGIVACFALAINLLLIVAIMIQFKAAFTLPGLAGLVLTVGMSVDANVLIFERIREERARGAALRMAIRNGFGRATTTIVDANLTTLITAVVLYGIGTDQIRGFALTLIFGILMSMYTAIFCSRVVFDIAERKRFIGDLHMMQFLGDTRWNFVNKQVIAGAVSGVLVVAGIAAIVVRGADIFDIDFTGGTSAQIVLKEPMEHREVLDRVQARLDTVYGDLLDEKAEQVKPGDEQRLAEIKSLRRDKLEATITMLKDYQMSEEGEIYPDGVMWKIDTSIPESELLQTALARVFRTESGESMLVSHHLDVNDVQQVALAPAPVAPDPETDADDNTNLVEPPATSDPSNVPAVEAAPGSQPVEPAPPADAPAEEPEPTVPAAEPTPPQDTPPAETADPEQPAADDPRQAEPRPPMPPSQDEARLSDAQQTLALAPLDLTQLALMQNEAAPADESQPATPAAGAAPEEPVTEEPVTEEPVTEEPAAEEPAAEEPAAEEPAAEEPAAEEPAAEEPAQEEPAAEEPLGTEDEPANTDRDSPLVIEPNPPAAAQGGSGGTRLTLQFDHGVTGETVLGMVQAASERLQMLNPRVEFLDPAWNGESKETHEKWTIQLALDKDQAEPLIANMQTTINEAPVFLSVSKIGGTVAGNTRDMAIAALAASLLGIVAYIWFRFQKMVYGLAAVAALVHDVLIVVGAIAISAYLAPVFGFLLIEEFKISLPIVAALLTIIGYSLNDTIVIFDRLREVKGKNPALTVDMVNTSINQTLSRTLLTSTTTLLVVLILYAIGGEGIHGFAFALLVGVVVGTYSSIFVASPILLWLGGKKSARTT